MVFNIQCAVLDRVKATFCFTCVSTVQCLVNLFNSFAQLAGKFKNKIGISILKISRNMHVCRKICFDTITYLSKNRRDNAVYISVQVSNSYFIPLLFFMSV